MHIAFATDAAFLPWCGVAIRSCLDHCDGEVTIHVLHDGTLAGEPGMDQLRGMVDAAGGELVVHGIDPESVRRLPVVDRYGTVVWLRILLPELLPDVERVLYLDVDTLVAAPLEPLIGIDLAGAPLGAVANVMQPEHRARIRALGISDFRRFLNSGVLLLDLDLLRAEDAAGELLRVAAARADELVWPDQDALNLVFAGRWCPLHPRWNAQNTFWNEPVVAEEVLGEAAVAEARRRPGVLHFEGPTLCKPWHSLSAHPWRRAWWETLDRTPWRGTPAEDRSVATAALRLFPQSLRIRGYGRLLQWRDRRRIAS